MRTFVRATIRDFTNWDVAVIMLIAISLSPLITNRGFATDWYNHIWLINHYASSLRDTASWPSMISTGTIESGFPSFYGFLFYPILSLPALVIGADSTVRLFAVTSTLIVFIIWRNLAKKLSDDSLLIALCGASAAITPYHLTNLYHRSALTEYFAQNISAAVTGLILSLALSETINYKHEKRHIFLCALLISFIIGTHPPTAYMFILFVAPLLVVFLITVKFKLNRKRIAAVAISSFVTIGFCSLWLRDTIYYSSDLQLRLSQPVNFPLSIDSLFTRLCPIPIDLRLIDSKTLDEVSTPFLSAPANGLILILSIYIFIYGVVAKLDSKFLGLLLLSITWSIFVLFISLHGSFFFKPEALEFMLQRVLSPIQFIYRIVGPLNLVISITFLLCLNLLKKRVSPIAILAIAKLSIAMLFISICVKVTQVDLFNNNINSLKQIKSAYHAIIKDPRTYPYTFYGASGYVTKAKFTNDHLGDVENSKFKTINFTVNNKMPWRSLPVKLATSELILRTNVFANPFFSFYENGIRVPDNRLIYLDNVVGISNVKQNSVIQVQTSFARHLWLNLMPVLWVGLFFCFIIPTRHLTP